MEIFQAKGVLEVRKKPKMSPDLTKKIPYFPKSKNENFLRKVFRAALKPKCRLIKKKPTDKTVAFST